MSKPIRVKEVKLQRGVKKPKFCFGQADRTNKIAEVDPRQPEEERIDTVLHEAIHIALPKFEEPEVRRLSEALSSLLWAEGYRRVRLK